MSVQRAVTSALLAYLLATGGFAGWFPVRMKLNVARMLVGLMALFGSGWLTSLINNAAPDAFWWADAIESCAVLIVCIYWVAAINAAGEEEVAATAARWDPARLNDLTRQLDQMQAQLSRRGF